MRSGPSQLYRHNNNSTAGVAGRAATRLRTKIFWSDDYGAGGAASSLVGFVVATLFSGVAAGPGGAITAAAGTSAEPKAPTEQAPLAHVPLEQLP